MKNGISKEPAPENQTEDREEISTSGQVQTCLHPMNVAMTISGIFNPHYGGFKAKVLLVYRSCLLITSLLFLVKTIAAFWFIDKKMLPAQIVTLMWILLGISNLLLGVKANSTKYGHLGQMLPSWNELTAKLNTLGIEYKKRRFRRTQVILLILATLINGIVFAIHVVHLTDNGFLQVFDVKFITAPFEPTVGTKTVVALMAGVQMMLFSIPVVYTIVLCILLRMQFEAFDKHLSWQICQNACTLPDTFQELRFLHASLCRHVSIMDRDLKYYYGNSFVWKMLMSLTCGYMMLRNDENIMDRLIYVYYFALSIGFLLALSIYAAQVNDAAHAPLETIYFINVSDVNFEKLAQINLFLSKLTGTQVGFSTCGLLIITKEFILTIAGVFLTYFAVLYTL